MSRDDEPSSESVQKAEAAKAEPSSAESAEQQAEHLQAEVEAARDDLGDLVGELDRRRHRAARPLVVGAIVAAVVGIGGYVWWRTRRSRPAAHRKPFGAGQKGPSATKKILTAAATAAASVAGRRAAERR